MKKIIVLTITLLLLTLVIVTGCDSTADEVEDSSQAVDNGEIISEEPDDETELPEGLPVYPGATFIGHFEGEIAGENIYEYLTTDSPEDVCVFYVEFFEAEGFEDFFYMCDSEMAEVQVQRDGQLVTVNVNAENEDARIIISIRPFEG